MCIIHFIFIHLFILSLFPSSFTHSFIDTYRYAHLAFKSNKFIYKQFKTVYNTAHIQCTLSHWKFILNYRFNSTTYVRRWMITIVIHCLLTLYLINTWRLEVQLSQTWQRPMYLHWYYNDGKWVKMFCQRLTVSFVITLYHMYWSKNKA